MLMNSAGPVIGFSVLLKIPGLFTGLDVLPSNPGPLVDCIAGFGVGGATVDTALGVVDFSALPGAEETGIQIQLC
jgi:hypothetical protein